MTPPALQRSVPLILGLQNTLHDCAVQISFCLCPDHGLDNRGFEYLQRQEISLCSKTSTVTLYPIRPPIQWVPGALSKGKTARALGWPPNPISCAITTLYQTNSPFVLPRQLKAVPQTWLLYSALAAGTVCCRSGNSQSDVRAKCSVALVTRQATRKNHYCE